MRGLVRETRLSVESLVYPLFAVPGTGVREEIPSMPGNYHLSVDEIARTAAEAYNLGVPAVLLFGLPEDKDPEGRSAFDPAGTVQRAVQAVKRAVPGMLVITDVCLCQYTDHGHCGIVNDGVIDNDASLEMLQRTAVSHAEAGADMVAPSDMMDGRVMAIREALDDANLQDVAIMSYAAKYASAYYGPFREAAHSAPTFGDRRTYQMDPANSDEALREVAQDIEEGADIVMVKPALAYLDIVRRVKDIFRMPVAAYNVSGEVAMIKAAARNGWLDEKATVLESLTAMARAGADILITYYAKDVAQWLR